MGIVRAVLLCLLLNALGAATTSGQETGIIPPLPEPRGDESPGDVERLPATNDTIQPADEVVVVPPAPSTDCTHCSHQHSGAVHRADCLHRCRGFCCDGDRSACYVPPFGSQVRYQFNAQIARGQASLMTLYRYDFEVHRGQSLATLNTTGKRQLQKMARRLERTFAPIQIEATGDADLDQQRRAIVVQELAAAGYPISDDQVVVGRPSLPGLSGEEAILVHESLLENTRSGGVVDSGDNAGSAPATFAVPLGF